MADTRRSSNRGGNRDVGSVDSDIKVRQALNHIFSTYGDRTSVDQKKKSLLKFGTTDALGTSAETVWWQGGDEVLPTTNAIDKISSSDAGDTEDIYIEGHTVSGTGSDAQYTFVTQTVTLAGQTETALTTPLARTTRAYVNSANAIDGDVYVYEDDTVTSGVPQTAAKIHMKIGGTDGQTQSLKCATTFSNTDYYILTSVWASVGKKQSAIVDFTVEVRQPGSVFRPILKFSLNTTAQMAQQINLDPYRVVPKNADIRVRAVASATGVEVNCSFNGLLASVIS